MRESMFLAVDLAGTIHNVALCAESAGAGLHTPGWLVRSRIERMRSWVGTNGNHEPWQTLRDEIRATVQRWGVSLADFELVHLTRAGQGEILRVAASLEGTSVCFPATTHVISPRAVAPAVNVKDYTHRFESPRKLDLRLARDAFVGLMEQAAEDVQSDGLEQDDSFLDRYAELRVSGQAATLMLPMETLTEPQWLLDGWRTALTEWHGQPVSADAIEVVALHLRCAVETSATFAAALAASDGRLERARIQPSRAMQERAQGTIATAPAGGWYDRAKLLAGDFGRGPAVIVDGESVIPVPADWRWEISPMGHLLCRSISD